MEKAKNKEEVIAALETGKTVYYRAWHFSKHWMGCGGDYNCCEGSFEDLEDAIGTIERYLGRDNWTDIKIDDD